MKRKPEHAWLADMAIVPRLLVHLASAQSRFESAIVSRFRDRWTERQIREAMRQIQRDQLIDLMAIDRVRWALTAAGRSAAQRAREAAKRRRTAA